jgi:hypothetical protein
MNVLEERGTVIDTSPSEVLSFKKSSGTLLPLSLFVYVLI